MHKFSQLLREAFIKHLSRLDCCLIDKPLPYFLQNALLKSVANTCTRSFARSHVHTQQQYLVLELLVRLKHLLL